jgi:HK97 family phage major capsid protein
MLPTEDQLALLEAARDRALHAAERTCLTAKSAGRTTLTELEQRSFDHSMSTVRDLNEQLETGREDLARAQIPARYANLGQPKTTGSKTMISVNEPELYRRGGQFSFAADLVKASNPGLDLGGEARQRLQRHTEDMAERGMEFRDISRVDGAGGYAVPPAWLMDMYVELARPGRAFANVCQRLPLPGGTDSINIPKVLTGTAVGVQTADNQPVTQVDLTDTFINAPVRTIAGQEGVSIQLIDQSSIQFDQVIFSDLIRAHGALLDQQVIYGNGASGQVLGVANTPSIQTVAVATLDIAGIFKAIANSVQLINTTRYLPPEVIVMHPRRWSWLLSLLDTQNRPLFVPEANNPMNAAGVLTDVDSQQIVGRTHGLPVVTDPGIATNLGAGTNEDQIYVMRSSDLLLWESGIRARVLPETRAANLTVLIQVFSYFAFSAARYPASVVQLTGLLPPTF